MTTTPSIKLYFAPFTRATRPRWLLEELGVPYELVTFDAKGKDHKAPNYIANVHPHGAVPACVIDGVTVIESGAIVAALADRFIDKGLAPALASPERPTYLQWLFYCYATMEPALVAVLDARNPEKQVPDDKKKSSEERWAEVTAFIERSLTGKSFILGEAFSAADVILGAMLVWANASKLLDGKTASVAYVERMRARPAFSRARK